MARIPLMNVTATEKDRLKNIEASIKSDLFGQDKAVEILCKAVKRSRAGFRNPERPEGCFLFVGPTGVGKTELAKLLSRVLDEKLLRYDMSEYQEKYSVSRLIGSAPGYVGYEEGGQLTDEVRKNPHAVILFDEIEKAHEDIYNILLQVLDYGFLTDNQGRKADFRNCMIIMTSNAGARDMEKLSIGFGTEENDSSDSLSEAVNKAFSPEFRNRLDAIVPFSHLPKDVISQIVAKEIHMLENRLENKKVKLTVTQECMDFLADIGYSKEFGARNISRTVNEKISSELVDEVLFGKLCNGGNVTVDVSKCKKDQEELVFEYD